MPSRGDRTSATHAMFAADSSATVVDRVSGDSPWCQGVLNGIAIAKQGLTTAVVRGDILEDVRLHSSRSRLVDVPHNSEPSASLGKIREWVSRWNSCKGLAREIPKAR